MDTFNVNISVDDCCVSKCNTSNRVTTQIITSLTEFIPIQCNYYLKILSVTSTYVVISIDNTNIYIVRKIYSGIPIKICIPNNCNTHTLTITVNSITT